MNIELLRNPDNQKINQQHWILFSIILVIAFLLRFYGISFPLNKAIPPGLWFDEALNGLDAYTVHTNLNIRLTYPDIFPREGMFLWLLGFMTYLLGDTVFALRFTSCLISTAAVASIFFLIKEAFNVRIALISMTVIALMRWHIHFGHLIFRTNLVPLFSSLALLFILRAKKPNAKKWDVILCGFFIAAGFYTYLAWYFIFPVLIFSLLLKEKQTEIKGNVQEGKNTFSIFNLPKNYLILMIITFFIFLLPLMLHYVFNPAGILARPAEVSPFKSGLGNAAKEIIKNTIYVISMFLFSGDHVAKHNLPYRPVFGSFGLIFFWLGILSLFVNIRNNRFCLVILVWILFSSLPSVVSKTDSANMLRNLGASAPAAIIYSVGIICLINFVKIKLINRKTTFIVCFSLALIPLLIDLHAFYFKWRNDPRVKMEFLSHIVDIAEKSVELSSEYPVAVSSELADNLTFKYLTLNKPNIYWLNSENPDLSLIKNQISIKDSKGIIVIQRIASDSQKKFLEKYPKFKIGGVFILPKGLKWAEIYFVLFDDI